MKKLIAVAILGLTAVSGWAQGTVDFRNGGITFPTTADRKVYLGTIASTIPGATGPGLVGANWVAGLWYLAGADRGGQIASATQAGGRTFAFRALTTTVPGAWVAPAGVSPIFTFPDVAVGGSATLQVRVWDSSKFNSYDAAVASGADFGASAPFNYTVPAAGSTPDKYYMDNLRAFAVTVPEPSTIALGVLGLASLLYLRRRK